MRLQPLALVSGASGRPLLGIPLHLSVLAAFIAVGCGGSGSGVPAAPSCTPSCSRQQTCVTICLDGGGKGTECATQLSDGDYVDADGGGVDVCAGF